MIGLRHHFKPTPKLSGISARARENVLADIESARIKFEPVCCLCGCGSSEVHRLASRDRHGLDLGICLCSACGLVYCNPYLDQDSADYFYSRYYRDLYEGGVDSATDRFLAGQKLGREMHDFLASSIAVTGIKTVLEVGCAAGGLLSDFADRDFAVTGLDLDDRYLDFGRRKGLNLLTSSLEAFIDERPAPYDLVIMSHVLEHLQDPIDTLIALRKIIQPDGYLLLEVPNIDFRAGLSPLDVQLAHKWYFDEHTLSNLLAAVGYEVMKVEKPFHLRLLCQRTVRPEKTEVTIDRAFARRKYQKGRLGEWLILFYQPIKKIRQILSGN